MCYAKDAVEVEMGATVDGKSEAVVGIICRINKIVADEIN